MPSFAALLPLLAIAAAAEDTAWPRDEVHALVEQVKPPARFAEHRPKWSVSDETVTFQHVAGPKQTRFRIVKDGAGIVAVLPVREFYDGSIFLQCFRPEDARPAMDWPTGRWHIDTARGSELRTLGLIPRNHDGSDTSFTVSDDGRTLVYRRRFTGLSDSRKGEMQGGAPKDAKVEVDLDYTFTFRVDPVHGYCVDGRYVNRVKSPLSAIYLASSAPAGRYDMWPGRRTSYATVIGRLGEEGYVGWFSNMGAIPQAGGVGAKGGRDGSFAAYLDDRSGWSSCVTSLGGPARLAICNAHSDVDFTISTPAAPADAAGWHTYVAHHRLLGLPPELTARLAADFRVQFAGQRQVQLRLGVPEDMEAQPLPCDGRETGVRFGGTIVEGDAHSGRKALRIEGAAGGSGAQLILLPRTRYRLEAWLKPLPWTAAERAARQAEHDRRRTEAAARKQALIAKGDAASQQKAEKIVVPDAVDLATVAPKAWFAASFYEWTPHNPERLTRFASEPATTPGTWTQAVIEFTTPAWDPFLDPRFHSEGGAALVDDFQLVALGAVEDGIRATP